MSDDQTNSRPFVSGFAAIVGAPNAGKSTLLNRILGEKISITSRKPQTTRNRILGILHKPASQLIFLDTPGIHPASRPLNVRIVDAALSAMGDVDLVTFIVDLFAPAKEAEQFTVDKLKKVKKPVILALNKSDLVDEAVILETIDWWSSAFSFASIVPVSAKNGSQVETLVSAMEDQLPKGVPFFPEEMITDIPERFLVAEIVREKVFRLTGEEIPHSAAVTVERFDESDRNALVKIYATIHVERASQKGIVIGKGGSKLKRIGEDARKDIQRLLGARVFLKLFVRVQKNWSKDTRALRRFGY